MKKIRSDWGPHILAGLVLLYGMFAAATFAPASAPMPDGCYPAYLLKVKDGNTLDRSYYSAVDHKLKGFSVQSSYKLSVPAHLIIHAETLELRETVGEGNFTI